MIACTLYYAADEKSKDGWITSKKPPEVGISERNRLRGMSLRETELGRTGWEE